MKKAKTNRKTGRMDSGDVHKFMSLERYFPIRAIFNVFDNLGSESCGLAPFGLETKFAERIDLGSMLFCERKVCLIENDYLQLIRNFVDARMRLFKFFGRKANPVKVAGKRM